MQQQLLNKLKSYIQPNQLSDKQDTDKLLLEKCYSDLLNHDINDNLSSNIIPFENKEDFNIEAHNILLSLYSFLLESLQILIVKNEIPFIKNLNFSYIAEEDKYRFIMRLLLNGTIEDNIICMYHQLIDTYEKNNREFLFCLLRTHGNRLPYPYRLMVEITDYCPRYNADFKKMFQNELNELLDEEYKDSIMIH